MEIRKLFLKSESATNAAVRKQQAETEQQANTKVADKVGASPGEDVVSFSPLSRQLLKVADIVDEDSKSRAARVEELKKKVQEGSYSVSSSDVAKSLVSFASDLSPQQEV